MAGAAIRPTFICSDFCCIDWPEKNGRKQKSLSCSYDAPDMPAEREKLLGPAIETVFGLLMCNVEIFHFWEVSRTILLINRMKRRILQMHCFDLCKENTQYNILEASLFDFTLQGRGLWLIHPWRKVVILDGITFTE